MKITRSRRNNFIFLVVIVLLIIPQTRQPIQVALHSVLSRFGPSIIDKEDQKTISYTSWELKNLKGNKLNLKNTQGKVVFLNFWATWCPPCIAEFQGIQDLYDDYNDNVEFVLISEEEPEVIQKFLDKNGYHIQIFKPLTNYPNDFNVRSIPRTYIIDKQGHIIVDKKGAANWNSKKIRQQLDKLIANN